MPLREPNRWPHTGAILAGGRSTRMGRRKEHIVLADGKTMIERVADVLAPRCARLVIVGDTEALPELQRVHDLREGQGPLGGIEALLASGIDDTYLVVPCDVPQISAEVIEALTRESAALATVLQLEGSDEIESLPARISVAALPQVRAMLDEGRRAVHALMGVLEAESVTAPQEWRGALRNVNEVSDLEGLRD